jgi:hypothetical protein
MRTNNSNSGMHVFSAPEKLVLHGAKVEIGLARTERCWDVRPKE